MTTENTRLAIAVYKLTDDEYNQYVEETIKIRIEKVVKQ